MSKNNYTEMKEAEKRTIKTFFTSTLFLTNGLLIIGFIIIFAGFALGNYMFTERVPDLYLGMVMLIGLPWFMVSCLFVILRREIPRLGLPSIKGRFAVFQGYLGFIIVGIAEIYIIFLMLS